MAFPNTSSRMASVLPRLLLLSAAALVASSAASVGTHQEVPELPEARAESKDDLAGGANLMPELCGPRGDFVSCILGAFLGDVQLARGYHRFGKKMILPLLVGILLKVASFVPLILGKLSLLAIVSIVASKMALVISAIVGTKRLYSAGHMYGGHPYSGHHDWDHAGSEQHLSYAEYPHAAHPGHAHRRVVSGVAGVPVSSLAMARSARSARSAHSPYQYNSWERKAQESDQASSLPTQQSDKSRE